MIALFVLLAFRFFSVRAITGSHIDSPDSVVETSESKTGESINIEKAKISNGVVYIPINKTGGTSEQIDLVIKVLEEFQSEYNVTIMDWDFDNQHDTYLRNPYVYGFQVTLKKTE